MTPRRALLTGLLLLATTGGLGAALRSGSPTGAPHETAAWMEDELFGEGPFEPAAFERRPVDSELTCPGESPETSQRLAELADVKARARGERYAFHPASGPWAARLWAEASVCWRAAGAEDRAAHAAERKDAWRTRVLRDVRTHRLRLARSKKNEQLAEALAETKALRAFFEDGPARARGDEREAHPRYSDWLAREARRLERYAAR